MRSELVPFLLWTAGIFGVAAVLAGIADLWEWLEERHGQNVMPPRDECRSSSPFDWETEGL